MSSPRGTISLIRTSFLNMDTASMRTSSPISSLKGLQVLPGRHAARSCSGTGRFQRGIAFLHCIGSRDENANLYCSRVCCMASMKQAHLAKEKTGAEIYEFYIDINAFGKGYQEFYKRVREEGVFFIRGKGSEIFRRDGRLVVAAEDTLLGTPVEIPVDMVVRNRFDFPSRGREGRSDVWYQPERGWILYGGPSETETREYERGWDLSGGVLPGAQRYP